MRLDIYTVQSGLIKSRERAKEYIKNGYVTVNDHIAEKPSFEVSESDNVKVTCDQLKYVGRGGLKLEKALDCFKIELNNKFCIDIGASTGGFTDCMLQNGAVKVYAVDVGHGQLDFSLINDSRVVNLEKTNIVNVKSDFFNEKIDFISVDVSFVSLKHIIPKVSDLLSENGHSVLLIKPQFEAGKACIGKNGIVKDRKAHIRVINEIILCAGINKLSVCGLDFSPVSGGHGNIEYLLYISKSSKPSKADEAYAVNYPVEDIVNQAFCSLNKKR